MRSQLTRKEQEELMALADAHPTTGLLQKFDLGKIFDTTQSLLTFVYNAYLHVYSHKLTVAYSQIKKTDVSNANAVKAAFECYLAIHSQCCDFIGCQKYFIRCLEGRVRQDFDFMLSTQALSSARTKEASQKAIEDEKKQVKAYFASNDSNANKIGSLQHRLKIVWNQLKAYQELILKKEIDKLVNTPEYQAYLQKMMAPEKADKEQMAAETASREFFKPVQHASRLQAEQEAKRQQEEEIERQKAESFFQSIFS